MHIHIYVFRYIYLCIFTLNIHITHTVAGKFRIRISPWEDLLPSRSRNKTVQLMWTIIPAVKFWLETVSTAFNIQIYRSVVQGMDSPSLWQEQLCHTMLQTSEKNPVKQFSSKIRYSFPLTATTFWKNTSWGNSTNMQHTPCAAVLQGTKKKNKSNLSLMSLCDDVFRPFLWTLKLMVRCITCQGIQYFAYFCSITVWNLYIQHTKEKCSLSEYLKGPNPGKGVWKLRKDIISRPLWRAFNLITPSFLR